MVQKLRGRILIPDLEVQGETVAALETRVTAAEGDIVDAQADATQALADAAAVRDAVAGETVIGSFLTAPLDRKVLTVAAGPNNETITVAHGITGPEAVLRCAVQLANVGGSHLCFDQGGMVPATAANAISVLMDGTNVTLTSGVGGDYSGYSGHIVLEYTKA